MCDRCHRAFPAPISIYESQNVTIQDVKAGPCPWCGNRTGTVPAGVFRIDADDVVRLREALPSTAPGLIRLAGIVDEARREGLTAEEVAEKVEQVVPGSTTLASMLRDPAWQGVGGIVGVLALITALLALLGVHAQ